MKESYVYILASKRNGTLYIGVTTNLEKRIEEHRLKTRKSFTQKYNVYMLVHYEIYFDIQTAIEREKRIKKWNRLWKLRLIEERNPDWNDLFTGFPLDLF
jgi:putative endonuclease